MVPGRAVLLPRDRWRNYLEAADPWAVRNIMPCRHCQGLHSHFRCCNRLCPAVQLDLGTDRCHVVFKSDPQHATAGAAVFVLLRARTHFPDRPVLGRCALPGLFRGFFYRRNHSRRYHRRRTQTVESADAFSLNTFGKYRYVVFSQVLPLILPPLTGLMISLIKHSVIGSVFAVADLTTGGMNLIADTFMAFKVWFLVAGIYLAVRVSLFE